MAATRCTPTKFDAQFRWWREYDIIFLYKTITDTLRKKIAKADSISRIINGIPTTLSAIPHHESNQPRDWFTSTVGFSRIRKQGYWSTPQGQELITLAEFHISCYKGQGLRPFGTVQEVMSSKTTPFGLQELEDNDGVAETDSDWEGNDIVLEYSSQDPDIVEMMSPMNHIDKSLTSETMTQIVTKGAYSSLHPLFTKITDCANNKRRAGLLWKCLQHTHQLLLNDLRKDEIKSGALQEGIASDPTNTSGRKRSNARTKRPQDKHRPKKKRKNKP